jgi:Ca2+-binding RTX toxin-like protein
VRGVLKLVALGAILAGVGAASAWAATIHGNARGNVIHGTPHADTIYGLAGKDALYGRSGNDKLYGGAGDDLLVGGPGADLLNCGPGHDTAVADKRDKLIGCEVVKGLHPAKRKKPPHTTTTTAPAFQPGRYCGYTINGGNICFDITVPPAKFTNAQYQTTFDSHDCNPPAKGAVNYTTGGSVPVHADGTFDFKIASGDQAGTEITGTVDTSGGATGNLHVQSVISSGGTTYTCTLNGTWTAKK